MDATSESVQRRITIEFYNKDTDCWEIDREGKRFVLSQYAGLKDKKMIKSKDIAALYTAEQREEICRCCRKNNHNNCKDCAIPVTAARKGE